MNDQISQSRIDAIGTKLLDHGIGLVSQEAAQRIAAELPETPLNGKALIAAVKKLADAGEIQLLDIGGHIVIE